MINQADIAQVVVLLLLHLAVISPLVVLSPLLRHSTINIREEQKHCHGDSMRESGSSLLTSNIIDERRLKPSRISTPPFGLKTEISSKIK